MKATYTSLRAVFSFLLILLLANGYAQGVKIGTSGSPDPSAIFETESTTQGFLPPRMTTAQRDAISSPAAGLIVFNTDTKCVEYYRGVGLGWYSPCPTLPTLTTSSVSNTGPSTASGGGNISDDGGASVITRGVCWSTTSPPTIADNITTDGSGIGTFSSTLTGLSIGTTYYVRAYATNSQGTAYGNEVSFVPSPATIIGAGTSYPGTQFSASTILEVARDASKAFDNSLEEVSHCWHSAINDISNAWIKVQFPAPRVITEYRMWRRTPNDQVPKNWVFEGSNDNSSWTLLDTRTNAAPPYVSSVVVSANPYGQYTISNTTPYTYYRLRSSATDNGSNYTIIGELEYIGY